MKIYRKVGVGASSRTVADAKLLGVSDGGRTRGLQDHNLAL